MIYETKKYYSLNPIYNALAIVDNEEAKIITPREEEIINFGKIGEVVNAWYNEEEKEYGVAVYAENVTLDELKNSEEFEDYSEDELKKYLLEDNDDDYPLGYYYTYNTETQKIEKEVRTLIETFWTSE